MKITELRLNDGSHGLPKNPRFIRDSKFAKLVASVRDNPEFMPARPIIIDEGGVVLGGNMRLRACQEIGMAEIPDDWVRRVTGWTTEKKRRFIILDNRGFGEDDMDMLANEWDLDELLLAGFSNDELGFSEEDDDKTTEEKTEDLRPIRRLHVLVSMTSDHALDLLPKIEAIAKQAGAEVHSAGN